MVETDPVQAAEAFIERLANDHDRSRSVDFDRRRTELRREDAQLVRRELLESALDLKRLDALAATREQAHRALAEEAHRSAIEASGAAAARLRGLMPNLVPATGPQDVILDQVLFVRSFLNAGVVSDSGTYPGDNWAQYRLRNEVSGRLSFFTLWRNSQNRTAFVSAAARLMVNAHLKVSASGTGIAAWLVGFDTYSKARVTARTTLWAMWDQTMVAVGDETELAKAEANAGFSGDSSSRSIEFNDVLPAPAIAVPKQEYLLIEVELLTDHSGESIDLDAESGAFRVDQPSITLTLTT